MCHVKERRPQVTLCRSHSGRLFAQSDQRSKPTHTLLCPYNVELPALIANSGVAEQHTSHYLLLLLCSPCLCLLSLPAFLLPYQDLSTQLVSFNKACPTLSSFLSTQLVSFKEACPSALLDYAKLATRSTVPPNDLPFRQPHPTIYDTIHRSASPTQRHDLPFRTIYRSAKRSTVPPAPPNVMICRSARSTVPPHDLAFRHTIYRSASRTQRHEAQCVSAGYPYAFVLSGRAVLSTVTLLFLVDMLS